MGRERSRGLVRARRWPCFGKRDRGRASLPGSRRTPDARAGTAKLRTDLPAAALTNRPFSGTHLAVQAGPAGGLGSSLWSRQFLQPPALPRHLVGAGWRGVARLFTGRNSQPVPCRTTAGERAQNNDPRHARTRGFKRRTFPDRYALALFSGPGQRSGAAQLVSDGAPAPVPGSPLRKVDHLR